MGKIQFTDEGWEDYLYWQAQDRKTLKKINNLIRDIGRNEYKGIGKPEELRGDMAGFWSRRIDGKNRLIYRILEGGFIEIGALKTHYGDK
jgi:toxin YoeB